VPDINHETYAQMAYGRGHPVPDRPTVPAAALRDALDYRLALDADRRRHARIARDLSTVKRLAAVLAVLLVLVLAALAAMMAGLVPLPAAHPAPVSTCAVFLRRC
jgi:hypothetical protein